MPDQLGPAFFVRRRQVRSKRTGPALFPQQRCLPIRRRTGNALAVRSQVRGFSRLNLWLFSVPHLSDLCETRHVATLAACRTIAWGISADSLKFRGSLTRSPRTRVCCVLSLLRFDSSAHWFLLIRNGLS